VHPFKPVRDKIIRNKSAWVPAVLRYNSVPAKMLLEVCNLANDQDRRLIQTRAWRQKVSEAVVKGLLAYYGEEQGGAGPAVKTAK
jgi:N-acetylmuramoyl-L-alanine amidase